MTTRARPIRMLISAALLLALIVGVQLWLGWGHVLSPWLQLSLPQVLMAAALLMLTYVVRALRLTTYFATALKGQFLPALRLMLMHNFWNNLLPMRSGELSFPLLMQRYFRIPPTRSLPALFWFRLLDLYVILMLAVFAVLLRTQQTLLALAAGALLTLVIPATYQLLPRLLRTLERRTGGKLQLLLGEVRESLPGNWGLLFYSCGWTLINWIVKLAVFSWVIMQFSALDAGSALLGAIGGELTSVLPVHGIAGAGSYEAGVSLALVPQGVSPDQALQAAINLHLFLLSGTLISALASFGLPKPTFREQTETC